jgi:hypothetical protein
LPLAQSTIQEIDNTQRFGPIPQVSLIQSTGLHADYTQNIPPLLL